MTAECLHDELDRLKLLLGIKVNIADISLYIYDHHQHQFENDDVRQAISDLLNPQSTPIIRITYPIIMSALYKARSLRFEKQAIKEREENAKHRSFIDEAIEREGEECKTRMCNSDICHATSCPTFSKYAAMYLRKIINKEISFPEWQEKMVAEFPRLRSTIMEKCDLANKDYHLYNGQFAKISRAAAEVKQEKNDFLPEEVDEIELPEPEQLELSPAEIPELPETTEILGEMPI
jgi:hypothetical protein